MAAIFLKKAIEAGDNMPAEKDYLKCMLKMDRNFDVFEYVFQMVERYKKILPARGIQSLIIDLAFLYWKEKKRIDLALKHFLEAIEIDPAAGCLTVSIHMRT